MTTRKDISDKHLVDYAFGLTKEKETQEVEQHLQDDAQLRDELDAVSAALGAYAQQGSPKPSQGLKDKIKAQLDFAEEEKPKVVAMNTAPAKTGGFSRWYAIAASLALVISLGYTYSLKNELSKAQNVIAGLQESSTQLAQREQVLKASYQELQASMNMVRHEKTHVVHLKGTEYMPNANATVMWNEQTKEVFVDATQLPGAPEDHQHQLWALVNGVPVDLGVFDITGLEELQKMKSIDNADAFAVTLEITGGSETPTLERLCVLGEI